MIQPIGSIYKSRSGSMSLSRSGFPSFSRSGFWSLSRSGSGFGSNYLSEPWSTAAHRIVLKCVLEPVAKPLCWSWYRI